MAVADTLVSEASSTIFDFLALGKFGVIYDLPCERLKHSDGKPLLTEDNGEFLQDAFVHVQSPDQLRVGIERALRPSAEMRRRLIGSGAITSTSWMARPAGA